MNPSAPEFVPSWLSQDPVATVHVSPENQSSQQDSSVPEPPDTWEDDVATDDPSQHVADGEFQSGVQNSASDQSEDVNSASEALGNMKVDGQSGEDDQQDKNDGMTDASPSGNLPGLKGPEDAASPERSSPSNVDDDGDRSAGLDAKKPLNVVLLGHVDAGKSTISGHLLYLTGNVDDRTLEKYEKEAKALNRESWKYAWALDTSEQERAKGKTEEYGQASFMTESRRFTMLDAPGHKNFVPHMIGGTSQADIGILVISARKGEFETGFERGGQTREHAMLAKTSGVRQIVVVINKLDDPSVLRPDQSWSEERFLECKTGLEPYLKQIGWNIKEISWIPVSGITGDNLKCPPSDGTCPWYRGPTLLDTLESLQLPKRLLNGPVRLSVTEKHKEMGTMVKGKLESGVIREGDKLVMMPNRVEVYVDAVDLEGSDSHVAEPGDNVRLRLKGIDDEDIRCGFVLCSPNDLVSYTDRFDVQLMILEHKSIICAGYSAVMHVHQVEVECSIVKLRALLDKKTGKISEKNPKFVRPGMKCIARMQASQAVCIEPFKVFPQLGRFMLRDEGKTIAVGVVLKVLDPLSSANDASVTAD